MFRRLAILCTATELFTRSIQLSSLEGKLPVNLTNQQTLPREDNGSNPRTVVARFCKEEGRRCKEAIGSSHGCACRPGVADISKRLTPRRTMRHVIQDSALERNCGIRRIAVGCW